MYVDSLLLPLRFHDYRYTRLAWITDIQVSRRRLISDGQSAPLPKENPRPTKRLIISLFSADKMCAPIKRTPTRIEPKTEFFSEFPHP